MGDLYKRSLDDGQGQVGMTEIPLDGSQVHITQYNAEDNTRQSWNTDGDLDTVDDLHFTNQNVGKHDPNRHEGW